MWKFKDQEITELEQFPEGTFGFVYKVTHTPTGKQYIGRKQLLSVRTKKLTKKELELQQDKRKSKVKKVTTEGDWKTYYGSNPEIRRLIKEGRQGEFSREILVFVNSKKLLTYYETKYLFSEGVLENQELFFNDNILGKFFSRDFG